MSYELIDKVIENKKADRENKRLETLFALKEILSNLSSEYGFSKAYIFGSVAKNGKFRYESDIDIAVFDLRNEDFFRLMSDISSLLGRDVDLYRIEEVDEFLRKRIEDTGILWMWEGWKY